MRLEPQIENTGFHRSTRTIDLPLSRSSAANGETGFAWTRAARRLSQRMDVEMSGSREQIHAIAGLPSTSIRRSNWPRSCTRT